MAEVSPLRRRMIEDMRSSYPEPSARGQASRVALHARPPVQTRPAGIEVPNPARPHHPLHIRRKIEGNIGLENRFGALLDRAADSPSGPTPARAKALLRSLHAPEVECIGRGK
jgi:hypothetical protein